MNLDREENVTKDTIGAIDIGFHVPDATDAEDAQYGTLTPQIKQSDGSTITRTYDLIARLNDTPEGQAHLAALVALRDFVVSEVFAKVLPLP